ncbi:putative leucine-rich repeat domain, L domain-containing protein [Rosa chinensis]|uniref:Putative leucine-rich repeat domain, L domain-containing protein n=1 Tax=Rosa chinensis TaxID=74649 RepID=A0A2P6Q1B1_ROSCH|nr:putative leucine-rich repeat domain, L domain-containing protein [Rosa chinensis]
MVTFAIAGTMHGLHHLMLLGNEMTNEGLCAILDGCPHLESLDLRQCLNLTLEGNMGRRCVE